MAAVKSKGRKTSKDIGTYDRKQLRKLLFTGLGAAIGALVGQAYAENPNGFEKAIKSVLSQTSVQGMSIEDFIVQAHAESVASAVAANAKSKKTSKEKPS
jgi:hypothetical protein